LIVEYDIDFVRRHVTLLLYIFISRFRIVHLLFIFHVKPLYVTFIYPATHFDWMYVYIYVVA